MSTTLDGPGDTFWIWASYWLKVRTPVHRRRRVRPCHVTAPRQDTPGKRKAQRVDRQLTVTLRGVTALTGPGGTRRPAPPG
jgi:hypothetical protein